MSGYRARRTTAPIVAALVAVVSLSASVVGVAPVGADPAAPPDTEPACGHVGSAGFTDTGGTGFEAVIDCLAAFGVTSGTTATTYSPAVQVRRSQMALFYHRVGDEFGLPWDTSDAGFGDLDGLDAEFVDAINALANAGIVNGTSATEFSPQDRIRRSQMALFIDRFQQHATSVAYSDGFAGDDLFPDISTLGAEARAAVNGIGSVGISQGDGDGDYVPSGFVSRQQMAAFIVRHLAENDLAAPGAPVGGVLVAYTSGSGYVFSDWNKLVEVDIEPGDAFFIDGEPATEAAFEAALSSSTTGLGHQIVHEGASDSHDVVPRDDEELALHGFVVGPDLDLTASPIEASLVELVSGITLVDSADLGWGDVDTYRVASTTVTESEFLDEINFGDTLAIGDEGGERIATLNNHSSRAFIGDEANIGAPDPGVQIAVQVDHGEFVGGNDLAGGDAFVLSQAAYDAGEQEFSVDGTAYDYTDIEDFLVNGTGGSTIGELVDGRAVAPLPPRRRGRALRALDLSALKPSERNSGRGGTPLRSGDGYGRVSLTCGWGERRA
ncbi:MAG: S-layer homology domain-containing protein [Acidimicrobiales bacterium]|nr:S-layer homology domain-containing protein [Acidimicrobiales bacterium]